MGTAARGHAERFSWDRTADGLFASYGRAAEVQARRSCDPHRTPALAATHQVRGGAVSAVANPPKTHRGATRARDRLHPQVVGRPRRRARHPRTARREEAQDDRAAHGHSPWRAGGGVRVSSPDENLVGVFKYLLQRNRRLYGVAYTVDNIGDIYLVGQISTEALTPDEPDRVLGQILEAADGDFNVLLELGFATSIRREWAWRVSRREPCTTCWPSSTSSTKSRCPPPASRCPSNTGLVAPPGRSRPARPREDAGETDCHEQRHLNPDAPRRGEWNASNQFTGWVDVALTDKGAAPKRSGRANSRRTRRAARRAVHLPAAPRDHHRADRPGRRRPAVDPGRARLGPSQRAPLRRPAGA